ncbi:MAG: hypothetical protein EZS28_012905 [Streblomastix strix]|uniref:Protein kinase domain-containing protein n=1 Tax=Streblomastix strix TaxID=222440 RepID=A0A5J4WB24_9EUKA|nr:MAG: hypothetical protein EZS28_012905 [Streblomastix strix]
MSDRINKYEYNLRRLGYVPIRPLGGGSFGLVFLIFNYEVEQIMTAKIISKEKFNRREWEAANKLLIDIKCDNILLHSPPGSGRVHIKMSDFGLAKQEDLINEQIYVAGTLPYMV